MFLIPKKWENIAVKKW